MTYSGCVNVDSLLKHTLAVFSLLLTIMYPLQEPNLYLNTRGSYRLNVVLEHVILNKGMDEAVISINDFLSNYCFETSYFDQSIGEAYVVINKTVIPLRVIGGCLRALNNTLINIPPGRWVNITFRLSAIVDLELRSKDLSRILDYLSKTTIASGEYGYIPTRLWNYTHPIVKLVLKYFQERTKQGFNPVNEVLGYVNRNIVYLTTVPSRYPWETIVTGSGDCDDQSNLIITLLRGLGFNAYLESGLVFLKDNYILSFSSSDRRYNYVYKGGFMHSWVLIEISKNLSIRVDPVVAKPFSDPVSLVNNAYFYNNPVLVMRTEPLGEDYIMKTYVSMLKSSGRSVYFNVTLSIHGETLSVS